MGILRAHTGAIGCVVLMILWFVCRNIIHSGSLYKRPTLVLASKFQAPLDAW